MRTLEGPGRGVAASWGELGIFSTSQHPTGPHYTHPRYPAAGLCDRFVSQAVLTVAA